MANEYLLGRAALPPTIWRNYRTLRAVLSGAGVDGGYPRSILLGCSISGREISAMGRIDNEIPLPKSLLY
jgi:hypothetical protein